MNDSYLGLILNKKGLSLSDRSSQFVKDHFRYYTNQYQSRYSCSNIDPNLLFFLFFTFFIDDIWPFRAFAFFRILIISKTLITSLASYITLNNFALLTVFHISLTQLTFLFVIKVTLHALTTTFIWLHFQFFTRIT